MMLGTMLPTSLRGIKGDFGRNWRIFGGERGNKTSLLGRNQVARERADDDFVLFMD